GSLRAGIHRGRRRRDRARARRRLAGSGRCGPRPRVLRGARPTRRRLVDFAARLRRVTHGSSARENETSETKTSGDQSMDITTTLSAFMELGARWVLWMLIGLSVAGLAVIFERIFFFASTREDVTALRAETSELFARQGAEAVVRRLEQRPST